MSLTSTSPAATGVPGGFWRDSVESLQEAAFLSDPLAPEWPLHKQREHCNSIVQVLLANMFAHARGGFLEVRMGAGLSLMCTVQPSSPEPAMNPGRISCLG